MMMVSRRTVLFGASALALLPATAWSQDQNLKIVYPFSAGNAGEAVARLIADRLQRDLHRPVIVENKSGASGRIGARVVKDALADGTVLLFAVSSQMTIQPHLATDVGYDPFADFAPVSQVMAFDQAVAVPANSPIQSFRELIDWYRANPEQAIYGSPGVGTGPHLVALEFARAFQPSSSTCRLSRHGRGAARLVHRPHPDILYGERGADGAPRQRQDQNSGYRWRATITAPA